MFSIIIISKQNTVVLLFGNEFITAHTSKELVDQLSFSTRELIDSSRIQELS
jgi:hypothetical protein